MSHDPTHYVWWLVSRAAGIVALILISLSVVMGLAMATKVVRRPALKRVVNKMHEHVALTALMALAVHGISLLGDPWLNPGWRGIVVPFAMSYRPLFTGVGMIGAYIALLLGPSFYLRRRIGPRRWRRFHGLIVVAWLLSAVHTIGAGSDGQKPWLDAIVVAPVIPIVYLLIVRVLAPAPAPRSAAQRPARTDHRHAPAHDHGHERRQSHGHELPVSGRLSLASDRSNA
jgi:sulfoxide reductase heme-binding subunit YedZ